MTFFVRNHPTIDLVVSYYKQNRVPSNEMPAFLDNCISLLLHQTYRPFCPLVYLLVKLYDLRHQIQSRSTVDGLQRLSLNDSQIPGLQSCFVGTRDTVVNSLSVFGIGPLRWTMEHIGNEKISF